MHFFVAKLLSTAVMTYTYVRNLHLIIRVIYYAHRMGLSLLVFIHAIIFEICTVGSQTNRRVNRI